MIHDEVVVRFWPANEPVYSDEYRDLALLDSAVNRPFQTFDEADLYPDVCHKAAALFHSLACNHCFYNGNKRTALVALDMFLTANSQYLLASNEEAYEFAKATTTHNERGTSTEEIMEEVLQFIKGNSVPFDTLANHTGKHQQAAVELHRNALMDRATIMRHHLNGEMNI